MRILLFETTVYGHHLEYIHHLYHGMRDYPNDELILVLPRSFESEKLLFTWDDLRNVQVVFLKEEELGNDKSIGGLKCSWNRSRLLGKYVKEYSPDSLFLISIMSFMPFLTFFITKPVKIYGILYILYVYKWKEMTLLTKCKNVLLYLCLRFSRRFAGIFVLNDRSSASYFNRKYKTQKFIYLPDPYNKISHKGINLRDKYHISDRDTVYLHFGAMTNRKGTIEILDAISLLSEDERRNKVFIFAGKIGSPIYDYFYEIVNNLDKTYRIVVEEGFCSNELLVDLCVTSDCILCPYKNTNLSSGVLAYAATYKKQVIGPSSGLIGKLILKYNLGVRLPDISALEIKKAICKVRRKEIKTNYEKYIRVEDFVNTIYNSILFN